jgi:hypothetical protein
MIAARKQGERSMSSESGSVDPLEFMKNLWGQMGFAVPGMVAPTLDTDELERRIKDLRAVEGWLRMNLNMLQVTIQGLEVQCATLAAVKAMSESMRASTTPRPAAEPAEAEQEAAESTAAETLLNPFNPATLWPWNLVKPAEPPAEEEAPEKAAEPAAAPKPRSRKPRKTGE